MWILTAGVCYMQQAFGDTQRLRIGHGVAYGTIFNGTEYVNSNHRWSTVLLKDILNHQADLRKVPFELNLTSNHYLLHNGDLWQDPNQHSLPTLHKHRFKVILSTDNDGIWPIDKCLFGHSNHHSLAAEFCRAISHGWLTMTDIDRMVADTVNHRFVKQYPALRTPSQPSRLLTKGNPVDISDNPWLQAILQVPRADYEGIFAFVTASAPDQPDKTAFIGFSKSLKREYVGDNVDEVHWLPQRESTLNEQIPNLIIYPPNRKVEMNIKEHVECKTMRTNQLHFLFVDSLESEVYVISHWSPIASLLANIMRPNPAFQVKKLEIKKIRKQNADSNTEPQPETIYQMN
jgi:hypothetical protein